MTVDDQKRAAAAAALELVQPGMRLGLGTGSTAAHFVDLLGDKVAAGLDVVCVPTSEATRRQAEQRQIPLSTLDDLPELDLTVDGADEIDGSLRLIKGGGGALLREKIVAAASRRMAVISDASKQAARLGRFPLPVEVNIFGFEATRRSVLRVCLDVAAGSTVTLRRKPDGTPFLTDGGHWIVDCALGRIEDATTLSSALFAIPGVVEHGLFIGLCSEAFIASENGVALLRPSA